MKKLSTILLLLVITVLQAHAGIPEDSAAALKVYESIYPYYAEVCAHSQILKLPGFGLPVKGNDYGHMTLYVKGLCRDHAHSYPTVSPCDSVPAASDDGVGISTDMDFGNANWVAVSGGRHFYYWGDLQPNERMNKDVYLRTRERAQKMGIYDGIIMSAKSAKLVPAGMTPSDYLWEDTFGTDFALNVARASTCQRIPMDREMLVKMSVYLNKINAQAHVYGSKYDFLSNNCSHTSHNALAATGYIEPVAVNLPTPVDYLIDSVKIAVPFNGIVIPFNEIVSLMGAARRWDLADPWALFQNTNERNFLLQQNKISTEPGILVENWPIYQDNDVYDIKTTPHFVQVPGLDLQSRLYKKLSQKETSLDLRKNLLSFHERLLKAQSQRSSFLFQLRESVRFVDPIFGSFLEKYNKWVDDQIIDVEDKLKQLND